MRPLFLVLTLFSLSLFSAEKVTPATPSPMPVMSNTVTLTLTPQTRMADIIEAFNVLRGEKGGQKVFLTLTTGEKINQISSLQPMTNQTLLLIRYSTSQGNQLRIVGIEEINGVNCLP